MISLVYLKTKLNLTETSLTVEWRSVFNNIVFENEYRKTKLAVYVEHV